MTSNHGCRTNAEQSAPGFWSCPIAALPFGLSVQARRRDVHHRRPAVLGAAGNAGKAPQANIYGFVRLKLRPHPSGLGRELVAVPRLLVQATHDEGDNALQYPHRWPNLRGRLVEIGKAT